GGRIAPHLPGIGAVAEIVAVTDQRIDEQVRIPFAAPFQAGARIAPLCFVDRIGTETTAIDTSASLCRQAVVEKVFPGIKAPTDHIFLRRRKSELGVQVIEIRFYLGIVAARWPARWATTWSAAWSGWWVILFLACYIV